MKERLERRADIVFEALGDEAVLYDSDGKRIHVLNATAKLIWELCDGAHALEDIELQLRSSFSGLEGRDVLGDIRAVLDTFMAKGLLSRTA
jgi:hypothetical protein